MAFIDCHFYSEALGVSASMYVILPQAAQSQIGMATNVFGKKHPTLYLLHGLSDDHTIWMRRTSIERYASELGIAVVMPAVNRSFYTDMAKGPKYWTFISEELPVIARSFFPLAEEKELNYVAGLSMGGYGAFKLALTHPERYAAAASLSGAVDVASRALNLSNDFELIYGDVSEIKGSGNDLFHLADQIVLDIDKAPKLYQCCGTEDFLYEDNIRFRDYCRDLSLDVTYEEEPGQHEWGYWDRKIQSVLNWLPLPMRS
ncbi:alpha/beta hydrolase family protein [Paenibacillus sp. N3.4]|uniref:alpha/beta hydrolase n=1 Tax=Paenibacillus sp. N3.4 TaxID=2603222 RepID=UPI0011C7C257|nr:alpha/beta hydrolase family protein [Paenibacillus sp. N3.4]TXK84058.1 esterase family protein [Paenibacillus sp. N3.4]